MLVEQCMNFACEMMDLCRGTQEVEAVISDFLEDGTNIRDPLGRLRLAIRFEEKKVCSLLLWASLCVINKIRPTNVKIVVPRSSEVYFDHLKLFHFGLLLPLASLSKF